MNAQSPTFQAAIWLVKRRRMPTMLQIEASESGAATLAIVLGFYGRFVPLEELRLAYGVSRDGASAGNIMKVTGAYRCQASALTEAIDALADLPLPMIVLWNFNHFVVLEWFGKQAAYLNDLARGPRTVTLKEFDQSFSGMALVAAAARRLAAG